MKILFLPKCRYKTLKNRISMIRFNILLLFILSFSQPVFCENKDTREFVELPKMMQQHMLSNMRDHLVAINEILQNIALGELDKAADIAENRLGMSSLGLHHASHMAKFMPKQMQQIGTSMHKAASRFALTAQVGDKLPAIEALTEITTSCVACHQSFKIHKE